MTALREIIEAVEAGDYPSVDFIPDEWTGMARVDWLYEAFYGSLDAAKALHDALLPGWDWSVGEGPVSGGIGHAYLIGWMKGESDAENDIPARAWLISILKAYEGLQK